MGKYNKSSSLLPNTDLTIERKGVYITRNACTLTILWREDAMKKMGVVLAAAVVLVSLISVSCAKQKVAVEEVAPAQVRSSESVSAADKAEIARLRTEIVSLQESVSTLTQANKGLAEELLAAKDVLKVKDSEMATFSDNLGATIKAGSKGKKAMMGQIAGLIKENTGLKGELTASQAFFSEKLAAADAEKTKLAAEMSALRTSHSKAIKELNERLQKKEVELISVQEKVFWQKTALLILALVFLVFGSIFFLRAKLTKLQPVTQ